MKVTSYESYENLHVFCCIECLLCEQWFLNRHFIWEINITRLIFTHLYVPYRIGRIRRLSGIGLTTLGLHNFLYMYCVRLLLTVYNIFKLHIERVLTVMIDQTYGKVPYLTVLYHNRKRDSGYLAYAVYSQSSVPVRYRTVPYNTIRSGTVFYMSSYSLKSQTIPSSEHYGTIR